MGIEFPIRLRSLEAYVFQLHGSARQLTYDESRILDRYAAEIVGAIQEAWPVDTGLSQSAWEWVIGTEANDYYIQITNDVDYVQYIHRAGTPKSPALWEVLIPAVIAAFGPRMLVDLRAAVQETEILLRRRPDSLLTLLQYTRQEAGL